MHLRIIDEVIKYPYTKDMLSRDITNVSFPVNMTDEQYVEWNMFPVLPVDKPNYGEDFKVYESDPNLVDDQWYQSWTVEPLSEEEINTNRIIKRSTMVVSRAQGKAALITAGLWSQVSAYVDGIEDATEKALAEVALNDTQEWRRTSPFLLQVASSLGINDIEMDELFESAKLIEL